MVRASLTDMPSYVSRHEILTKKNKLLNCVQKELHIVVCKIDIHQKMRYNFLQLQSATSLLFTT